MGRLTASGLMAAAFLGFAALLVAPVASAAPLRALYANVVAPDAGLLATVAALDAATKAGLAAKSAAERQAAYDQIDALIGPDLRGFRRGLDPLQRWTALPREDGGLAELANRLVEQGDVPEGGPLPDPRPQLLQQLRDLLQSKQPLGRLPQMRGAVCLPARFGIDERKVAMFAAAHEADAAALRFFAVPTLLRAEPRLDAPPIAGVPAQTLLAYEAQAEQPKGWSRYWTSDGFKGWAVDGPEAFGLSQQHLCFAERQGQYRIVGYFTYGL